MTATEPTRDVTIFCFGEEEPSVDREPLTEDQIQGIRDSLRNLLPGGLVEIRSQKGTDIYIPVRAVSAVYVYADGSVT